MAPQYIYQMADLRKFYDLLLQTAARVIVTGANGSLGKQMPGYSIQVHHLPEFTPTQQAETAVNAALGISIMVPTM